MSNARNLADLLDSTGDVKSDALDNVSGLPDAIDVDASAPADSLAIDASGNVDITGTVSLDNTLSIAGDGVSGFLQASGGLQLGASTNHDAVFYTNNTERMRILATGGITFNGDTSSANALDDYEEGTWTPVMSGISGWLFVEGKYTKIGNMVYAYALFFTNGGVSGSGSNIITGLPFTSNIGEGMCLGTVSRTYGAGMSNANWIVQVNNTDIRVTQASTNDTALTFSPGSLSRIGIYVAYPTDS